MGIGRNRTSIPAMKLEDLTFFSYRPIYRSGVGSGYAILGSYTASDGNFESHEIAWTPIEEVAQLIVNALTARSSTPRAPLMDEEFSRQLNKDLHYPHPEFDPRNRIPMVRRKRKRGTRNTAAQYGFEVDKNGVPRRNRK